MDVTFFHIDSQFAEKKFPMDGLFFWLSLLVIGSWFMYRIEFLKQSKQAIERKYWKKDYIIDFCS